MQVQSSAVLGPTQSVLHVSGLCLSVRSLQYPMTLLSLWSGDIYSLLNFMSFLRWLFIGVAVLGLIYLRYTKPDLPRPFKVRHGAYT